MDELQLRKTFLIVIVRHNDAKVAELQLNLYLIATGPYHHDFPLRSSNKTEGRICADLRISQILNSIIAVRSASVTLVKERPN